VDTEAVVNHHLQAFVAGDVDEVLGDYTEDSVLMTPDTTITGLDGLRAAFSGLFGGIFTPGTYTFRMDAMRVEGDVAYIVWHASCADQDVVLGTDTFVVRDGKIATQTYTAKVEPR
jgi:ketosteroid isomerase-like protein